jgi:LysM repeat protein
MHRTDAANNLRAKTGTIDRVSSLSGYVTARNGERLAFAIISNNVPSTWKAKRLEDRIGARLASFDRPVPTGAVTARSSAPPTPDMAAPAEPEAEPASREATSSYYTIRTGDTLDGIARRHGVSLTALQDANPGVNPRRLMPGDRVRLPGG